MISRKKALVTAGPTYEEIDPVRFIGNYSTGKMGYAIAEALADSGYDVNLVSGPTQLAVQHKHIKRIDVTSAQQMHDACRKLFSLSEITVLAAAVADYRPTVRASKKIKKETGVLTLELEKTVDIARELGLAKTPNQILIGFALETDNEIENATKKLKAKNLDFIVLNSLNEPNTCFGHNTNKIAILHKDGSWRKFELKEKNEVAYDIVNEVFATQLLLP